jgi:hypothetical protein
MHDVRRLPTDGSKARQPSVGGLFCICLFRVNVNHKGDEILAQRVVLSRHSVTYARECTTLVRYWSGTVNFRQQLDEE